MAWSGTAHSVPPRRSRVPPLGVLCRPRMGRFAPPRDRSAVAFASLIAHCTSQVFFKGRGTEQKMCKLEKGDRFAFSVEMHHARMSCKVLRRDPKMKVDPPVWMEISEVTIDNIHNEVAIAVAFGETAE